MADSQDLIGQGAQMAMDAIWGSLFGNAAVKARQGQSITAGDVGDTALTVGLNSLPVPAGVKGAQALKQGANKADKAMALAAIRKILKDPDISIVAPKEAMPEILNSRFKSQRELLSENPNFDPAKYGKREQIEEDVLGYALNTPPSERPIYGALANKTELPLPLLQATPGHLGDVLRLFDPRTNASMVFGLKNPVINKLPASAAEGTLTIGDSFAPFGGQAANLKFRDHPVVVQNILNAIKNERLAKKSGVFDFPDTPKVPYIEAQMAPSKNPINAIYKTDGKRFPGRKRAL